jgi:hypothetical protein
MPKISGGGGSSRILLPASSDKRMKALAKKVGSANIVLRKIKKQKKLVREIMKPDALQQSLIDQYRKERERVIALNREAAP